MLTKDQKAQAAIALAEVRMEITNLVHRVSELGKIELDLLIKLMYDNKEENTPVV